MKRTEYFATIEEANQYYPDGVPSGVIAIVGEGSQVLVSSDNAANGATQQYYSADMTNDEIVNTMVQDSYDTGYAAGQAAGGGGSSDITANDFLGRIINNIISAGYDSFVISSHTPDPSVLTAAFQAASNGLGIVYKASGDTFSTLPLYNPYDEETGSTSEIVYNDGNDENSYYDWMASAPISLQVGDMLGFAVGTSTLWVGPFGGSEQFVCETAGNYTVLMASYTDDETGDVRWDLHIVPSTQLSGDYSNITDLNKMTTPR
jgi:hypothetical protein